MFCKYCGNHIDSDSIFCSKCGKKVSDSIDAGQVLTLEGSIPNTQLLIQSLNGVEIDIVDFVYKFNLTAPNYDSIDATDFIQNKTNCRLAEATVFLHNITQNTNLLEQVKDMVITRQAAIYAKKSDSLSCPICHCQQIHIDKKGYGLTKGIVGAALLGPLGLIVGQHKSNQLRYTCVKCGHFWIQ